MVINLIQNISRNNTQQNSLNNKFLMEFPQNFVITFLTLNFNWFFFIFSFNFYFLFFLFRFTPIFWNFFLIRLTIKWFSCKFSELNFYRSIIIVALNCVYVASDVCYWIYYEVNYYQHLFLSQNTCFNIIMMLLKTTNWLWDTQ